MNLWDNFTKRLLVSAIALSLFSCEQESSLLGFPNPNKKFRVNAVEFDLETSVLLLDSVRTSNFYYSSEVNRMLVGQYNDPDLGLVSSTAYTQFFTSTPSKLPADAVFDSASLEIRLDYYLYGAPGTTNQSVSVYELSEGLSSEPNDRANYFNDTDIALGPLLGGKTFSIDKDAIDDIISAQTDTLLNVKIALDPTFGARIWNQAVLYRDNADSTFVKYTDFVDLFKGIAIVPDGGDKVFGIAAGSANSRIVLHYHTPTTDSLIFSLPFASTTGFNKISGDRSGTPLADLNMPFEPFLPGNGLRYLQAGTGIFVKVDFSPFLEFADTVENVVINEAALIVEGVQSSPYDPPASIALRILTPANRMKKFSTLSEQDVTDVSRYNGTIIYDVQTSTAPLIDRDSVFYLVNDVGRGNVLNYESDDRKYTGYSTLFFQQLLIDEEKTLFTDFLLFPASPNGLKSVNRAVFPASGVKLRITYTKPTLTE